ncbi:MAG: hypothetical protein HY073_02170 [Deltaproteobacteria bacterium]|nr:hypothetical protein [Deltaproteobacteria bacterium]
MIQLILSSLPIDEVPGRMALATFFEDLRPLKGSSGLIDWRLNGKISDLILQGRLSGSFSESLIMPSQGRLAAKDIFMFGLGNFSELSEKRFEEGLSVVIEKICKMKSGEVVISFGDLAKDFMGWRTLLRSFMSGLAPRNMDLQVVCAEDPKWIAEAKKRNMDFGPEVALSYS